MAVFDALAFRARGRRVPPTIAGLADAGTQWIAGLNRSTPVVVFGHSTGAQVALETVLALQPSVEVGALVLSGLRHRPEERVASLRVPLTVTAGEADAFAPAAWLEELAARAGGPARAVVLPESHNNVFRYAQDVAALVVSAATFGDGRP